MDNLQEQINQILREISEIKRTIKKDDFSNFIVHRKPEEFREQITLKATVKTGSSGVKFGDTGEKIGFLGANPVARHANIADPTGGGTVDAESRAAINSILDVLEEFGLTS